MIYTSNWAGVWIGGCSAGRGAAGGGLRRSCARCTCCKRLSSCGGIGSAMVNLKSSG